MDSSSNLYGTTTAGGTFANTSSSPPDLGGTVFELTPAGVESVLWSFGNGADGAEPEAGLIMDGSGNLFGTTLSGGADQKGTVFELTPPTSGGAWTESVVWSFGNGTDGTRPVGSLIMDSSGNLYGTTEQGGANGVGTVFELIPPSMDEGSWTESILWNFNPGTRGTKDGFEPEAGVIMDTSGNLFGTTGSGGIHFQDPSDHPGFTDPGIVFELTPPSTAGGSWTESILRNFGESKDGNNLQAGVIIDKSGNLYGTTNQGGANGAGTAFELTPPSTAKGKWTESVLWNFGNSSDGTFPGNLHDGAGLIMDTHGNLFGTSQHGGADPDLLFGFKGFGTVFEIEAVVSAAPAELNFGNVAAPGTSKPKKVTLTNKDTFPARISTVTATAPFTIASSRNTCSGETIAPKKTCSFEVEFAPTTVGEATGSIDVTYNGTSPAVALTGNGIAGK